MQIKRKRLGPSKTSELKVIREFLHAPSTNSEWGLLDAKIEEGATEDEKKKARDSAESVRQRVAAFLQSVLTTPNLLVLAGSGTSMGPAKGPSMTDLWTDASEHEDFEDVLGLVKHPEGDRWIENLLSRCKGACEFLGDASAVRTISEFLKDSEKLIWKKCSDFIDKANLDAHRTFLRRMARRRVRAPRFKLFTTNYDLCFERAASDLGLVAIDGFSFSQPRRFNPRFFAYDVVRRGRGGDDAHDFVEGVLHIIKLHGSVDWDRRGIELIQSSSPEQPCLMYPMNTKYEQSYSQPHLELMAQFQSALREPNTAIVAVGFGFNDNHLTANIMAAVDSNPSLKLLVVDSAAKERCKKEGDTIRALRERISKYESEIAIMNADFVQFAELIPNLKALSPAEQIEQSVRQIAKKS